MSKPAHMMIVPLLALSFALITAASCSKDAASGQGGSGSGANSDADAAKAKAIVAEMKELYATCDSYLDEGHAESILGIGSAPGGALGSQPFFTSYKRGEGFRFEERMRLWGGQEETVIIWARGEKVRFSGYDTAWFEDMGFDEGSMVDSDDDAGDSGTEGEEDSEDSDDDADRDMDSIAAESMEEKPTWETAVHHAGTVSEIPRLLMPDRCSAKKAMDIGNLQDLRMDDEEEIDGAACYKIVGTLPAPDISNIPGAALWAPSDDTRIEASITLWIDKETKALRRLARMITLTEPGKLTLRGKTADMPQMRAGTVQHFKPRFNDEVAWHDLLYGLPGSTDEEGWGMPFGDRRFKATKKRGTAIGRAASKVMKETLNKYATCESYRDSGVIEIAPVKRGTGPRKHMKFRTAYVQPGRFRYEYRERSDDGETWNTHIISSDKGKVRTWWLIKPGIKEWRSLKEPAEEMSFETEAPIRTVAGLMMPVMVGDSLLNMGRDFILLGYEDIDGKRCYRICGRQGQGWPFTLWIDKKSKLVLRVEEKYGGVGHPIYRTTTYKPRINKKVADKYLKFNPPDESSTEQ